MTNGERSLSVQSSPASAVDVDLGGIELADKVRLLTGASSFTLHTLAAAGLGEVRLSDGPTGVRGLKFTGGRVVALFPNATLLASAWDQDALHEVGRLLAEEAMAQQIHAVLGPTINLHRSPLGGRLFEAFSEDPLLTGKLAAAYVRGMQEQRVAACLKHLVANESETDRRDVSSEVDEATLRELYLLPFEIAVAESDPWSIMAAYNDVRGVASTEQQHVNNEVLKAEWGYTGLLISDWFATRSVAAAANGGLDLVMPGPDGPWGDALVTAVRAGQVDETVVDDQVRRVLRLAERVGALGTPRDYPDALPAPDSLARKEQLTRLAARGITVLKNDAPDPRVLTDKAPRATPVPDTLPILRGTRVALIGRHAIETIAMGGGSAQVNPPYQVSVGQGLRELLGDALTVTDGVEVRTRAVPARNGFLLDPVTGEPGIRITRYAADGMVLDERHSDFAASTVGFDDEEFGAVVTSARLAGRIAAGPDGAVEVGAMGQGTWSVRLGGLAVDFPLAIGPGGGFGEEMLRPPVRAIRVDDRDGDLLEATVTALRQDGGRAVGSAGTGGSAEPSDGVGGSAEPSNGAGGSAEPLRGVFGLVARTAPADPAEVIAAAARAAAEAEVAVVLVGLTDEQETEAVDKTTLRLPGEQDALVSAVTAAANRTVVVVNAATPVLMPWLDDVDAVLWAGLPGQEGGHAIAAALLGDIEPAGRLVTTFPVADGASPAWSVTPVDGKLEYTEGTFIGYRGHHAGRAPAPAFWFGHGLGYSTWDYADAHLITAAGSASGSGSAASSAAPVLAVTVTNTGPRTSREVVQVYFAPAETGQPIRLAGWSAVTLPAGESAVVQVRTDARMWRRWDTAANRWAELGPGGRLVVARGLGDVRAELVL